MPQPQDPTQDAVPAAASLCPTEAPRGPGPYAGLTPHARGGFGEVLRGTDPALNRPVAVKRLQGRHAGSAEARRRFLVEAEVTARLEHPGVVPVYGLLPDDGSGPAYAMRFVQGRTLWDAVAAYHAGPPDAVAFRRLLQAFLQVCQTVAYAHSRGVIHRDLKPQNVMLGQFGEALVMDWGLAKVVGRPEGGRAEPVAEQTLVPGSGSGDETAMGSAVGTPAYMSPEQAAGRWDVIDHASDVYGLGAVLYALLAGKAPLEKGNWPEMQQRIQQGDFPRPRQVRAGAPRALEAVCLRAMALRPEDRYASALALAADVEHWLADEPVSAYREPLAARARRWMRRHRTLVTAAAVLLLTALVGAGIGLGLLGQKNRQVAAERNAARRAADEAEAMNAFLTEDLLGQASPDANSRERKVTVEELLAKAAAKIDGNPKFAGKPEVEATLRLTIAKTCYKLGNLAEAEKHFRRAMELRREHLPTDDPRTLEAQEAFADFLNLAQGRFSESEPLARQTWEARARVLGAEHRDTLDSLDTYSTALRGAGRVAEATARCRECLEARRRTLGATHPDTLTSTNNLATLRQLTGESDEAISLLREVLRHRNRNSAPTPYSTTLHNLANTLYLKGDLDGANQTLKDHLDWSVKRFTINHRMTDRARGLLPRIWLDQGKVADAVALSKEVLAYRRSTYPAEAAVVGLAFLDLGLGQELLGRHAEAEAALAEARKILKKAPEFGDYYTAWADLWYGVSLAGLKRHADAEKIMLDAERQLRKTSMTPPRHRRVAAEQIVKLYEAWGRSSDAARWRKRREDGKSK